MKVETHISRKIKYVRERWTEWFMFKVSGVYLANNMPIPKYFGLVRVEFDFYYLVFKPLIPFVVSARYLYAKWMDCGYYHREWFAWFPEEGERFHWFWPIYFIPKRNKYDRGN